MSNRRNDLAMAIMAAGLITGQLKAKGEREELAEVMAAQDVSQALVRDTEGIELGRASLVGSKPKARIADVDTYLAWVKANHPDQVREIVDNAYTMKLLKAAEDFGAGVDPSTGALIPGILVEDDKPHVRVTPNAEARERMASLLESSGLLKLTQASASPETVSDGFEGLDEEDPW